MKLVLIYAFVLAGVSCASKPITRDVITEIRDCIDKQVELYGDLCAEGRDCSGGEGDDADDPKHCSDAAAKRRGSETLLIENHFEGVRCATESIRLCVDEALEQ